MKKYLFGIILVAFVVIALTNGCGGPSPENMKKACYANQRVLLGAVEMYNMDHEDDPIKDFKQSMAMEGGILIKERYLRRPIELPHKECHYTGSTSDLTEGGVILCDYHGSYETDY
jgi:hypothetical protein